MSAHSEPQLLGDELTIPHNDEVERALIDAALCKQEAFDVLAQAEPRDFHRKTHRTIVRALQEMHADDEPADLALLRARLDEQGKLAEVNGAAGIADICSGEHNSLNAEHYAEKLRDIAARRRIFFAAHKIWKGAENGMSDEKLFALVNKVGQRWTEESRSSVATETERDGGELDLHTLAKTGTEPEPVPHLMKDDNRASPFVDGDITVLAAEGEGGKSTLALGVGLSLATGTKFAERFDVPVALPVLYYDGENNERLIKRRWLRLLNGSPEAKEVVLGWDQSQFRYRWRGNLTVDTLEGRSFIIERCQEYGSKVLVLDTQIRFTAGDLMAAKDAAALYGHLSEIKRRAELRSIIMLAHLRKRAGRDGVNDLGQRLFGSVDIRNSCDCLIVLVKQPDAGVTVVHEKTRWDAHYPNFAVDLVEDGDDAVRLVAGDAVNSPASTVRYELEESERAGMLRKDLVSAVAQAFPDMKPAAVTKAVSREIKSRAYASKPEGKAARYWLRMYAPEDAA